MTFRPVWVVTLFRGGLKRQPDERQVMYVRAATEDGAIRCAKRHSLIARPSALALVATPKDLGCVQVKREESSFAK